MIETTNGFEDETVVVKERCRGDLHHCKVTFKGFTPDGVKTTQLAFIKACVKDEVYKDREVIIVDNSKLNLEPGIVVFFDLASGKCGYGHVLPGVIVNIFKEISKNQRPKLHWYVRYKGESLPNPDYPFRPRKQPW